MTVVVRFQLIFLNIRSKVYCISRSFAEQAFSRTQQVFLSLLSISHSQAQAKDGSKRTIVMFLSSLQQKEEIKEGTYKYHVYKSLRNDACLCAVRKPHNADLFDQCKSLRRNSVVMMMLSMMIVMTMMIKQTDDQQKYDDEGT